MSSAFYIFFIFLNLARSLLFASQFGSERPISDLREVKAEYLSCLKHLASLLSDSSTKQSKGVKVQDINEEMRLLESEVSPHRKRRS